MESGGWRAEGQGVKRWLGVLSECGKTGRDFPGEASQNRSAEEAAKRRRVPVHLGRRGGAEVGPSAGVREGRRAEQVKAMKKQRYGSGRERGHCAEHKVVPERGASRQAVDSAESSQLRVSPPAPGEGVAGRCSEAEKT